jgi:hypothetical protein
MCIYIYVYSFISFYYFPNCRFHILQHQSETFLGNVTILTKVNPYELRTQQKSNILVASVRPKLRVFFFFHFDIINVFSHWYVECNHLFYNYQNVMCCSTVQKPRFSLPSS